MKYIDLTEPIYLKKSEKNYNIWSNGYCEQWGILQTDNTTRTEVIATFEKQFTDLPVVTTTRINNGSTSTSLDLYNGLKSVTTQSVTGYVWKTMPIHWKATGYVANEA